MEPFKNIYNKKAIQTMSKAIQKQCPCFPVSEFIKKAGKNLDSLSMKERVVQITQSLETSLISNYKKNVALLLKTLKSKKNPQGLEGFILWPYSYYIETRGLPHWDTSMKALYSITQKFTGEFGVRPFLEKDPDRVYTQFQKWALDKNEHVRRWVSEGTRPHLPWGRRISHMKKKLKKNIQILELLKEDESQYVRTSVANHMSDITDMDKNLALKVLKRWNKNQNLKKGVCQSLRNLIKKGDPEALEILGYDLRSPCHVAKVRLSKKEIVEGDFFILSFEIQNKGSKTLPFMVDYIIHYPKANGRLSPKVFKLKSIQLQGGERVHIEKKISFKKVTTRVHYPGQHEISIQVNGQKKGQTHFTLKKGSIN